MVRARHMGLLIILDFATALVVALFGHRVVSVDRRLVAPDDSSRSWTSLGRSEAGAASFSSATDAAGTREAWTLGKAIRARSAFVSQRWTSIESDRHHWGPSVGSRILMVEQGWPRAMVWGVARQDSDIDHFGMMQVPESWIVCLWRGQLPVLPSITGVAINTAIWSIPWLALFLLFGPVRRALRIRRHHCPACNYNLAGLAPGSPCPECGNQTVPARHGTGG